MGKRLNCTLGLGGTQALILETLEPVLLGPSVDFLEPVVIEKLDEISFPEISLEHHGT